MDKDVQSIIAKGAALLFLAACVVVFCIALMFGLDREAARQQKSTESMCEHYSAGMNNWARQNNIKPPCEE